MKTKHFTGLVCVALAAFALPAAAQAPDRMTPAKNTLCDPLAEATPGLYGLCVAMCEAQDCSATIDPDNGEVTFDDSCKPSSDQLLNNYIKIYEKRGVPEDPPVPPCVTVACACWSEAGIDNIGGRLKDDDKTTDTCWVGDDYARLFGSSTDGGGAELAYAFVDYWTKRPTCESFATNPDTYKRTPLSAEAYATCRESVIEECVSRGLLP